MKIIKTKQLHSIFIISNQAYKQLKITKLTLFQKKVKENIEDITKLREDLRITHPIITFFQIMYVYKSILNIIDILKFKLNN